jgi:hypothetical protein
VYYSIVSLDDGWGVRFNGRTLATFASYVEARAFIRGRRSAEGRAS